MTNRPTTLAIRIIVASVMVAGPIGLAAQNAPAARPKSARSWTPGKTPWGEPDLQGVYSNKTITPFERPSEFAGKLELSDEEIANLESRAAARSVDDGRAKGTEADVSSAYNEFWWDRG